MILHTTFDYLRDLEENNDREWFEAHRDRYDAYRENLVDVADDLIAAAGAFDPRVREANPDPSKCVSRTHRDMRFNKSNKPPYKTDAFISLNSVGGATSSAGYYFHVERGDTYAGGGVFTTDPPLLIKVRERISRSYDTWLDVVESSDMKKTFPDGLTSPETLKVAPHGFDVDDPAIEYLRMKGFCANRPLTNTRAQQGDVLSEITDTFRTVRPLVDYINTSA